MKRVCPKCGTEVEGDLDKNCPPCVEHNTHIYSCKNCGEITVTDEAIS